MLDIAKEAYKVFEAGVERRKIEEAEKERLVRAARLKLIEEDIYTNILDKIKTAAYNGEKFVLLPVDSDFFSEVLDFDPDNMGDQELDDLSGLSEDDSARVEILKREGFEVTLIARITNPGGWRSNDCEFFISIVGWA